MSIGQYVKLPEVYSSIAVSEEVMRYQCIRPHPAGVAISLPTCLQTDATSVVGTGATAMRQLLFDVEPQAYEWRAGRTGILIARKVKQKLALAPPCGVRPETMRFRGAYARADESLSMNTVYAAAGFRMEKPEYRVLTTLPIVPPSLRSSGGGGGFTDAGEFRGDVGHLYGKLIDASIAFERALRHRRSEADIVEMKRELQLAVDRSIDNEKSKVPARVFGECRTSVAMRLKSKAGRFRADVLGKRVGFSARSVIVVDPTLRLDECGLPIAIAKVIFAGFLLCEALKDMREGQAHNQDQEEISDDEALRYYEGLSRERQMELLKRAVSDRCVVLNRAPTLHRLNFQAFKANLIEGSALTIHPLVCGPFNADFDGDTMMIYVGLSEGAQTELRTLMLPSVNMSSAASGEPVFKPSQDMILGIYYLTADPSDPDATPLPFDSLQEVVDAHAMGRIDHGTIVTVPIEAVRDEAPDAVDSDPTLSKLGLGEMVRTTAGRATFLLRVFSGYTGTQPVDVDVAAGLERKMRIMPALAIG